MSSQEGGLGAPTRHPLDWESLNFTDEAEVDEELRRVFDICHGCRRCFNLCESFPKLFDLIDESSSGELDKVDSPDFKKVVDACTLCDMCYMTKCPYVPPHEFNLDFPHLMLRYRAMERKLKKNNVIDDQLTKTDRNGKFFSKFSNLTNWSTSSENKLTRPIMEKFLKIDKEAELPKFYKKEFSKSKTDINYDSPNNEKILLFPTCFVNYNNPNLGTLTQKLLYKYKIHSEVFYGGCCGMPQLEGGDIKSVAEKASKTAKLVEPYIDKGYKLISLVPSCSLMFKFEWPLILPNDEIVTKLSKNTMDISEYLVNHFKIEENKKKLNPWLTEDKVTVHISCHSRAQNMGQKALELLRMIPNLELDVIERCSGHGGSWGVKKGNFEMAIKVGKPVARKAVQYNNKYLVSECPLANTHINQGMQKLNKNLESIILGHPIEILAISSGIKL